MRTAKLASALLFLLITIFVSPQVFAQTPKDEDNVQTMLYLPLLGNAGRQNMASTSIQPAIPVLEEWPTFYSAELHITFAYPPGWKVELPKNWGPATTPQDQPKEYNTPADTHPEGYLISLYPPEGQQGFEHNMIELTVQSYEIAKGESLVDWHKKMTELWDALGDIYKPGTVHTENITTSALQVARAPEQVLHIARTIEGYGRGNETVWLTKGRLVYVVNSATYSKEMEEVLRQLTTSIQFDADAPESLNELYKVDLYRPAIQETVDLLNKLKTEVETCDIVCKDAKASHDLGIEPDAGPPITTTIQSASVNAVNVSGNQKALPPDWLTPTYSPVNVLCGSGFHAGGAEFALDIQIGTGTSVYAAQIGSVTFSDFDPYPNPQGQSYGQTIVVQTSVYTAEETRTYLHRYAHLNLHE